MHPTLLILLVLAGAAAGPLSPSKASPAGLSSRTQPTAPRQLERFAQRQPGGLPGMSDGNEAVHPDGKPMPGAVPADRPNAPLSRSLQHRKPEAGEVPTAKKATGSRKKAPESTK
jgi:hypothetical protein